jgi:hypothetical protein
MKCPKCHHENIVERCAAPLRRACVNCGTQVSSTAKFCSECSHPLPPVADISLPGRGATRRNTSSTKSLLRDRPSKGERKQVTVLFADIKGSSYREMGMVYWHEQAAPGTARAG